MPRKSQKQLQEERIRKLEEANSILADTNTRLTDINTAYANESSIRHTTGKRKRGRSKYFVKSFDNTFKEVAKHNMLTSAECKIMIYTQGFVEMETNIILNLINQPASRKDLLELTHLSPKTFDKAIKGLSDLEIIYVCKLSPIKTEYLYNPNLLYKGEDDEVWFNSEVIQDIMKCKNAPKSEGMYPWALNNIIR